MPELVTTTSIPNIIHFVFGLSPDFGGRPFSFVHYLAVKTAYECNRPERIFVHYCHEPKGEWWDKARPYLTLERVDPPEEIFGNPLLHYAHKADVIRLEALLKHGGIYLDMDVLCIRSFAPLLKFSSVMGREREGGLCNAVILAQKDSEFVTRWHQSYATFRSRGKDEYWSEHSVEVPFQISKDFPEAIEVVGRHCFFWPTYHQFWMLFGVNSERSWTVRLIGYIIQPVVFALVRYRAFGLHLYESIWWSRYLEKLTPEAVRGMRCAFGWLFRRFC